MIKRIFILLLAGIFCFNQFCYGFQNITPRSALADFSGPTLLGINFYPEPEHSTVQGLNETISFHLNIPKNTILTKDQRANLATNINYFLTALTINDSEFWVNLNPNQPNRLTGANIAYTDMGKHLLLLDLKLKKDTAFALFPGLSQGATEYWNRVFEKAKELQKQPVGAIPCLAGRQARNRPITDGRKHGFAPTDKLNIPITFRVWIVPDKAEVYEDGKGSCVITKSTLKVLLESEYLEKSNIKYQKSNIQTKNQKEEQNRRTEELTNSRTEELQSYCESQLKELILPNLTYKVNHDSSYEPLRQIYNAIILAKWYKRKALTLYRASEASSGIGQDNVGAIPCLAGRQARNRPITDGRKHGFAPTDSFSSIINTNNLNGLISKELSPEPEQSTVQGDPIPSAKRSDWFRANAFAQIINSNNLRGLISKDLITPQQIFAAYLDSVKQGEYHLTKTTRSFDSAQDRIGDTPVARQIRRSYVSGGVELGAFAGATTVADSASARQFRAVATGDIKVEASFPVGGAAQDNDEITFYGSGVNPVILLLSFLCKRNYNAYLRKDGSTNLQLMWQDTKELYLRIKRAILNRNKQLPDEEQAAKEFLSSKNFEIGTNWKNLYRFIIDEYGYIYFKKLYDAAGENAWNLFQHGLPALKNSLGEDFLRANWDDIVRLSIAAGGNAGGLFQHGLPFAKDLGLITDAASLNTVGNQLVQLANAAGGNALSLFQHGLPFAKDLGLITDAASLNTVGNQLVQLANAAGGNAGGLFQYGLPVLKTSLGKDFLRANWDDIVRLGIAAGGNALYLFFYGLPFAKDLGLITDAASLNTVGNQLVQLANAAGGNAGGLFQHGLPALKNSLGEDFLRANWDDIVRLGIAAGGNAWYLFQHSLPALKNSLGEDFLRANWDDIVIKLLALFAASDKYTSGSLLQLLVEQYVPFIKDKQLNFFAVVDFYIKVIEHNRRIAIQVLDGILDGLKSRSVDISLSDDERGRIFEFVDLTHSFSPSLFRLYKQTGQEGLQELFAFKQQIVQDKVGEQELALLRQLLKAKGIPKTELNEAVIAVLQMAIPASGASFVKKEDIQNHFNSFSQAGDLRKHIPAELKDRSFGESSLNLVEYRLAPGKTFDPDSKLSSLLNHLRCSISDEAKRTEEQREAKKAFKQALVEWLADLLNSTKQEEALAKFYKFASYDEAIKQRLEAITDDYSSVQIFEIMFTDKEELSKLFKEVLDELDADTFPSLSEEGDSIANPESIKTILESIWSNAALDDTRKQQAITRVLSKFTNFQITIQILPLINNSDLIEAINAILARRPHPKASKPALTKAFFKPTLDTIRQEKAKFIAYTKGTAKLEFRIAKGIPFSLWGLNAGVCVAPDIKLWKDTSFLPLAIIDTATNQACGFIGLYIVTIGGKKYLTCPGINPSMEFLSQVKASELYPLVEQALISIAEAGGFEALYFPTDRNILSNRSDINKTIERKKYPKTTLGEPIKWNTLPKDYSFKDVYVVWERKEDKGGISSPAVPAELQGGLTLEQEALVRDAGGDPDTTMEHIGELSAAQPVLIVATTAVEIPQATGPVEADAHGAGGIDLSQVQITIIG
ncbi:MAG: hypothetical protein AB1755_02660 [Candidatus Omnitrophota bacterium]